MIINEIFYSIQGEGKSVGKPRLFIRTSGCNLKCSFCDTKYHINGREINKNDIKKLIKYTDWVITGGEPLLQQKGIIELIKKYNPYWVEIETNGTQMPSKELMELVDQWNISPKEKRFEPKHISPTPFFLADEALNKDNTIVKFVYTDKESEKFIMNTIKKFGVDESAVWVMPEGISRKEQIEKQKIVWDFCIKHDFNFSPRLHVTTWDLKRGI